MKVTLPLFAGILAAYVSAQSPLTNDLDWEYSGCYTAPQGHILDLVKKQNITSDSDSDIETCWSACSTRFAALGAGSCYCTDILPPTLQPLANDVNCTFPCPSKSSEACGGPIDEATQEPSALSLYDSKPPAPITYPDWQYDGCVEHFSAVGNLTHVATRDRITVEGCLNACDQANLKYEFAGLSGQSCYCATKSNVKEISTFADNTLCAVSCSGNTAESCGGPFTEFDSAVSLYSRPGGPGDAKVTQIFTGVLMTRTTSATEATKTTSSGGGGDGNGGHDKATGTNSAALATGTGKGAAEKIGVVGAWGLLAGLVGAIVI